MEEVKTNVRENQEDAKDILVHVTDYLKSSFQHITVTVIQKVINIASGAINATFLAMLGLLSFIFISLGIAWWLGNLISSRMGGFFLTAGIYIVIIVAIIIMRNKKIFPFLRNFLTKEIYDSAPQNV